MPKMSHKHKKRIVAHVLPQVVVQFPLKLTGIIVIPATAANSVGLEPNIASYIVIGAMIMMAVEGIRNRVPKTLMRKLVKFLNTN